VLRTFGNSHSSSDRGQTLTEVALVTPLFLLVLFGIIVLGLGIFYQQQLSNAAREGARFASLHSATSQCPTVSNLDPSLGLLPAPNNYYRCDPPDQKWPGMTAAARNKVFGLDSSNVQVTACWSGYWTKDTSGTWRAWDQVAVDPATGGPNEFRECSVRVFGWTPTEDRRSVASAMHVINPRTGRDTTSGDAIAVDCTKPFPVTTTADDMASNYSASNAASSNRVSVFVCYPWRPPLAGFLLIPETVTLQANLVEAMEYQQ
jgi:hypothetical protein